MCRLFYQGTRRRAVIRLIFSVMTLAVASGANFVNAQQQQDVPPDFRNAQFKNFAAFRDIVPGVDFFAAGRQTIAPYEKPTADVISKLRDLFKTDLPQGAIFICSNLTQKDSLYEPVVLKKGYKWVLISETPEVRMQEMLARVQAQIGDNLPEEMKRRLRNAPREMRDMASDFEQQTAKSMTQDIAYAVLQTMMNEHLNYRSSRVGDVSKSPLPDWLDVSIAAYVTDDHKAIKFVQDNMEQAFSFEDIISMSRPFVASSVGSSRGGGGFPGGGFPGGGEGFPGGGFPGGGGGGGFPGGMMGGGGGFPGGGFPGGGGGGGGFPGGMMGGGFPGGGFPGGGEGFPGMMGGGGNGRGQGGTAKSKTGRSGDGNGNGPQQRVLPKDEQDRMLFDGQSVAFFNYFMEKFGIEKMRSLIQFVRAGNESYAFVTKPDVMGDDFAKIEADLMEWIKSRKNIQQ